MSTVPDLLAGTIGAFRRPTSVRPRPAVVVPLNLVRDLGTVRQQVRLAQVSQCAPAGLASRGDKLNLETLLHDGRGHTARRRRIYDGGPDSVRQASRDLAQDQTQ